MKTTMHIFLREPKLAFINQSEIYLFISDANLPLLRVFTVKRLQIEDASPDSNYIEVDMW